MGCGDGCGHEVVPVSEDMVDEVARIIASHAGWSFEAIPEDTMAWGGSLNPSKTVFRSCARDVLSAVLAKHEEAARLA